MFGKKAKEIANLKAIIKTDAEMIGALTAANADCQRKLKNAQALIQRAEADRDAQKKRADENYAQYQACQKDFDELKALHTEALEKLQRYRNSGVAPFTAAVLADADGFEPPKPKKKK